MSFKDQVVNLVIKGRDLFSDVAKKSERALAQLAKQSETYSDRLKELQDTEKAVNAIEGLNRAIQKGESGYKESSVALDKLVSEQKKATKELKALESAEESNTSAVEAARKTKAEYTLKVKNARSELNKLGNSIGRNKNDLKKYSQRIEKAGYSTDKLGAASKELKGQQIAVESALNRVNKKIARHNQLLTQTKKPAADFKGSISGATSSLIALAGAYVGIDRLFDSVTSIFTTGDKFERLGVQFTALMGSFEAGEDATKWVKDFSKNTPLQLEQVSQAFVKLKAFGLDPMDGTMQAITDQAFKLGGSFQEVEGISIALGQAWAKQKLQGEEILQLVERGVPVWDLLAKSTGKNTVELQKLSTAGKLGRDVIKQLIDEMGNDSVGAAQANMNLLSGLISNAKDNLAEFYNLIASSGAMDWLKQQLKDLNTQFAEMSKDGSLQKWAKDISDAIISIGEGVKSTAKFLYDYRTVIGSVAATWATLKVGSFFVNVVSGSKAAIKWLTSLTVTQKAAAAAGITLDKSLKSVVGLLGKAGLAGVAALSVTSIVKLVSATWDLVSAENALKESRERLGRTDKQKNEMLREISRNTGVLVQSMDELNQAEKDGLIIYDLKNKAYASFSLEIVKQNKAILEQESATNKANKATENLANSTAATVEPLKLSTEQALRYTQTLTEQAENLQNVRGGMGGYLKAIDASIETLKQSGFQYKDQIKLLEQLKEKYEEHQTYLDATAKGADALEQAYKDLGITSTTELDKTVEKSREAFELIRDSKQPVNQIRDAFLQYAQAAITAAEASGKAVPEHLKTQAAALKLTDQYNKLTQSSKEYGDSVNKNLPIEQQLEANIKKTMAAMALNRKELNKNTTGNQVNGQALKALGENQAKLAQQTQLLNQVRELENANLEQLTTRYEVVAGQLQNLEESYRQGLLTDEEYNNQKQMLVQTLQLLQNEIDRLNTNEQDLQDGVENTTESLSRQSQELRELKDRLEGATEYTNLYAAAHEYLSKEFDFSAQSADELRQRYEELERSIVQNTLVSDVWWEQLARTSNQGFLREQKIIDETLALREYTEELESNGITLDRVNHIARQSQYAFSELGDEQLDPLLSAIDSARDRITSLRDDVNSTLGSLRDELDQLNDNQTAIEQRRYEQQQADLEAKLEAAEQANDQAAIKSAKESLRLSQEIYRTKQAQFKAEQKEREAQAKHRRSEPANSSAPASSSSQTSTVTTTTNRSVPANNKAELTLIVNNKRYITETKQSIMQELMNEIRREQLVGG